MNSSIVSGGIKDTTSTTVGNRVVYGQLGISLTPPAGFAPAKLFTGFERASPAAMVVVANIEVGAQFMIDKMTKEQLTSDGVRNISLENLKIGEHPALLLNFEQPDAKGVVWQKWGLLFGSADKTTIALATYTPHTAAQDSALLKQTLLSIQTEPNYLTLAPQAAKYTGIGPGTGKLKHVDSVKQLNCYTPNGQLEGDKVLDPFLLITERLKAPEPDLEAFATSLARDAHGLLDLKIRTTAPIVIDGCKGYEFIVDMKETVQKKPIVVYQATIFIPAGYVLIRGSVDQTHEAEFIPEFRAMAHGWKNPH